MKSVFEKSGTVSAVAHRLMVDLAEANIKQLDAKIFHEKDTAVVLGREAERLRGEVQLRANQLARVRQLLQLVTECKQRCDKHPKTVTLAYLQQTYTSLRRQFQEARARVPLAHVCRMASMCPKEVSRCMSHRSMTHQSLEASRLGSV
jgi:tuftelin-interacting protein 11